VVFPLQKKQKRKGKENFSKHNVAPGQSAIPEQAAAVPATEGANASSLQPPPEQRDPIPWNEVELPLLPHTLLRCTWRDGTMRPARVIERRPLKNGGPDDWEYYIHYRQVDRRMDCWKLLEDFDKDSIIPPRLLDTIDPKTKQPKYEEIHSEDDGHHGFSVQKIRAHEEATKVKNVEQIELGRHTMDVWYFSPLPPEYAGYKKLYFCEFDLTYYVTREELMRHLRKIRMQHPPGNEIYRNNGISMFEVDGDEATEYCRNLCALAKMFLDHKSVECCINDFLFYVMCECDERGAHIVGYFSKEKAPTRKYNLSCILAIPAYQRRGYGKFLVSFSYELSKIEKKVGTPETPLSDMGQVTYDSHWARAICTILKDYHSPLSVSILSEMTMFTEQDIVATLKRLDLIRYIKGQPVICAPLDVLDDHLKKAGSTGLPVDPRKIVWSPNPNYV
jgi:histone acetyltransferase MYST1